ncbi:MAG: hypothetical protein IJW92_05025 [Clostridia bacterium]|nr:hypothetical protein [Clostridia bacterium]
MNQTSKHIILNLINYLKRNITVLLAYLILYFGFQQIIGASPALIATVLLVVYSGATTISYYCREKLLQFEKANALTTKKLFLFSAFIPSPIYLFWFLFSMIPIYSYEVWLITGLPMVLLSGVPLYSLSECWKEKWKKFFWGLQILIYITCLVAGQFLGGLIFSF